MRCADDYPKRFVAIDEEESMMAKHFSAPQLDVRDAHNLTLQQQSELLQKLRSLAESMKGDVMLLSLCQTMQEYLLERNEPRAASLYEGVHDRRLRKTEADEV